MSLLRRSRPEHSRTPAPAPDSRTWRSRMSGRRDLLGQAAILAVAGAVVTAVWVLTGWWSLTEQTGLASLRGFAHPHVLFWGTDAFAVACALVALAAAVDNRSAPLARIGYALALAGSAYFNAEAAAARLGDQLTPDTLAMAAGVPLASFAALEIILAAVRATVRRWRGLPAPVGAPALRFGRLVLGGVPELRRWRAAYLDATRPDAVPVLLAEQVQADALAYAVTTSTAMRAHLERELDALVAAARDELAEQAEQGADQLRADYRSRIDNLREFTPAPALDVDQLAGELRSGLIRELDSRMEREREHRAAELDRFLAALPRTTASTTAPRSRSRSRSTGSGNGTTDTARMRAYWDEQRAAGRIPEGAELDRHVGRSTKDGHGRKMRAKWLEEETKAELVTAGASAGE